MSQFEELCFYEQKHYSARKLRLGRVAILSGGTKYLHQRMLQGIPFDGIKEKDKTDDRENASMES